MEVIKLCKSREQAFKSHFLEPVQKLVHEGKIEDPKDDKNSDCHRNDWLDRGRIDFDSPKCECPLTSSELVDLYCYYYLPMHYASSLTVFKSETDAFKDLFNGKNVYFTDIGCGPITSGIAFNHWLKDHMEGRQNIRYYGIDISKNMRQKAQTLLKEPNFASEYSKFSLSGEPSGLIYSPDDVELYASIAHATAVGSSDKLDHVVVINCSYVLASYSLDVDGFLEQVESILVSVAHHNPRSVPQAIIVYQNPDHQELGKNWNVFKQKMTSFKPVRDYPKTLPYSFESPTQSNRLFSNRKVSVDIIKNF